MCQYQLNYRHAGKTIYHEEAQTFEDVIKVFFKSSLNCREVTEFLGHITARRKLFLRVIKRRAYHEQCISTSFLLEIWPL